MRQTVSEQNLKKLRDYLEGGQNVSNTIEVITILELWGFTKDFNKGFSMSELVQHCIFDITNNK